MKIISLVEFLLGLSQDFVAKKREANYCKPTTDAEAWQLCVEAAVDCFHPTTGMAEYLDFEILEQMVMTRQKIWPRFHDRRLVFITFLKPRGGHL